MFLSSSFFSLVSYLILWVSKALNISESKDHCEEGFGSNPRALH